MDQKNYYEIRALMFVGIAVANLILLIIVSIIDLPVNLELFLEMTLLTIDVFLFTAIFINLRSFSFQPVLNWYKDLKECFREIG